MSSTIGFSLLEVHVNLEKAFLHFRLYFQMNITYRAQTFSEDHSLDKNCFFMSTFGRGITVTKETKMLCCDCHVVSKLS